MCRTVRTESGPVIDKIHKMLNGINFDIRENLGTLQGSVLFPSLSNVYMQKFDRFLHA